MLVGGSFAHTDRLLKQSKNPDPALLALPVTFYLFDLPLSQRTYFERIRDREIVASIGRAIGLDVRTPQRWNVNSEAEVEALFTTVREAGHEGLMVKSLDHVYQIGKRTDAWLKVKPEDDYDGEIVGFEEAVCGVDQPELGLTKGDRLGRAGAVVVRLEDGSTARPHGIPHELGRHMWENQAEYLGQWCEFAAMERDRQGGYRHPVFRRLRDAKR
ncbi:putative DNA ligase [Achromobacter phage vB_AxyP_19-32_Axy21]|uniref:DNA ligase n=1 Tax=Achromobacter phage vB_AxyP_19-32_Axy21 TaxID=2591045 RepID=A0A514CVS4_9CAUD|nr:putative DNA ligase [Achromobacter phage vB_AxyP_19-32_Axy21]